MRSLLENYQSWMCENRSNRDLLKYYFNVKYPPIYIREGKEIVEVWFIYPPPQLHTGILGPVNDVFKQIGKKVDISGFRKKHNIKGSGINGDLQGPAIK